jgi:hypothetical protein
MRALRIVVALVAVAGLVGGVYWLSLKPPYDPDFDTSVATPAYKVDGPIVLFDEGHHNAHSISRSYKPFAELIGNDGYRVQAINQRTSSRLLLGADVLVIVCARGPNDAGDGSAFAEDEASAIEAWLRAGGSLLLVTDHWPFGAAAAPLARRLGVGMSAGLVEDPANSEMSLGSSHLVFLRDNALIRTIRSPTGATRTSTCGACSPSLASRFGDRPRRRRFSASPTRRWTHLRACRKSSDAAAT